MSGFVPPDALELLEGLVTKLAKQEYEKTLQFPPFVDIKFKEADGGPVACTVSFCLMHDRSSNRFVYETLGQVEVNGVQNTIRIYM